ncbi:MULTISPECIES: hypothetical protein [Frankia]|uniref:Uncharacterized protein n=1 Tax=Frankia alni (strain DSM 45986 / CECT 9034 / ACN14a) TaxID=326424 RepID=Q0RLH6_FRAAA|nr:MULTISPECIES: hypothetical protein [Frankia]CAJ61628.1 hypothetical protein FRAAL2984 [Frankia alni ACN14a]
MLCSLADRPAGPGPWSEWEGWPSHADRAYQGEAADLLLVTVRARVARDFRGGLSFDVHRPGADPQDAWTSAGPSSPGSTSAAASSAGPTSAGMLIAEVPEPDWLVHRLLTHRGRLPRAPDPAARHAWDERVEYALVTGDGRELWLSGSMGSSEVVAAVDCQESDERVAVRVRIGVDPARPRPRPPRAGSEGGLRYQGSTGAARRWTTSTRLALPLGDRAVHDVGRPDNAARSAAREAWRRGR